MLFYHDNHVARGLRDYRTKRLAIISQDNVFYLVFRVVIGHTTWYHHEVFLFDSSLREMIERIGTELKGSISPRASVKLVFIRSLVMEDKNIVDAMFVHDFHRELRSRLADGNILSDETTRYLAFGFVGDTSLAMMEVDAKDALDGCGKAHELCMLQANDGFSAIQVCAISPVVEEIEEHYEAQVPNIMRLLSAPAASAPH